MTEKIGLESVFQTDQFQKGLSTYLKGIKTASVSTDLSAASMGKSLLSFAGSAAWDIAKVGAVAFAGAVTAVGAALMTTIGPASDLNETVSKVGVVFGSSADSVMKFAENSATAMGMSKNEALAAAGTYGNLFRSMGMTETTSADMSTKLVQLAADLASFNNIDPAVALDKLRAGLAGESEPLRTLGVNITAASVATKAMQMGLVESSVDMLKVADAQVKLDAAAKKSTDATRRFGAESLQARQAAIDEAKAQENLDKVMAGSTTELTAAQKAQATYALIMEQTTLAQGDFTRTADGLANQTRTVTAQVKDLQAKVGTALLPVINKGAGILSKFLSSQTFTTFLENAIASLTLFSEKAFKVIDLLSTGSFGAALSEAFGPGTAEKVNAIYLALKGFGDWISANWQPIAAGLGTVVLAVVVPAFIAWAGAAITAAGATIAAMAPVVLPILAIGAAVGVLVAAWNGNWGGIRDTLTSIWTGTLLPILTQVWTWIQTNLPVAIAALSAFWTGTLLPAITSVWSWISANLIPLFSKIGELITTVVVVAAKGWSEFFTAVLLPALTTVADAISKNLQPVLNDISTFITENAMPVFKTVADFVGGALKGAFDGITQAIGFVIGKIQSLIEHFQNLKNAPPPWFIPGSPTPFEIGMLGIGAAVKDLANVQLPKLTASLKMDAAQMSPIMATATGSTPSVVNNRTMNNTFNLGQNNINNGMDAAVFEARVLDVVRRNL